MANLRKVVIACLLVVAVNFALEVEARHTHHGRVATSHKSSVGKKFIRASSKHSKASRRSDEVPHGETVMQHGDPVVLEQAKQILRAMSDSGTASGFRFKVSGWLSGNKDEQGLERSHENNATFRDNFLADYLNQTTDLPVVKKERLMNYIRVHTKLAQKSGSKKNVSKEADEFEEKNLNLVKNTTQPASFRKNTTKSNDAVANDKDINVNGGDLNNSTKDHARGSLKYNSVFDALVNDEQKNAPRAVDGVMTHPTATTVIQEGDTRTQEINGTVNTERAYDSLMMNTTKKDDSKEKSSQLTTKLNKNLAHHTASKTADAKNKTNQKSKDEVAPGSGEESVVADESTSDSKKTAAKKSDDKEAPVVDDAESTSMDINGEQKDSNKDHTKNTNETASDVSNLEKNVTRTTNKNAKKNSSTDALDSDDLMKDSLKENSQLKKNATQPANSTSTPADTSKYSSKEDNDAKEKKRKEKIQLTLENLASSSSASKKAHSKKKVQQEESEYESQSFQNSDDSSKHLPKVDAHDDKRTKTHQLEN